MERCRQSCMGKALIQDFMLKVPQYYYLNRLHRDSVSGTENNRIAWFSDQVSVSLKDSIVKQSNRILREKNTISIPALWRNDNGIIIYTSDKDGKTVLDVPYHWDDFERANGMRSQTKVCVY